MQLQTIRRLYGRRFEKRAKAQNTSAIAPITIITTTTIPTTTNTTTITTTTTTSTTILTKTRTTTPISRNQAVQIQIESIRYSRASLGWKKINKIFKLFNFVYRNFIEIKSI